MKIALNTGFPEAASSLFYRQGLSQMKGFVFNEINNPGSCDLVIFMTYQKDLEEMKTLKIKNPSLRTAIADPRGDFVIPFLEYADYLLVDSLEMEDYWRSSGKPIIRYAEYPDIEETEKTHKAGDKIIIGYHGNLVHLDSSAETTLKAISDIAGQYDIELHLMYNIDHLGVWSHPVLENVKIKHIQWSLENYSRELAYADIGIVPNLLPVNAAQPAKSILPWKKPKRRMNYRDDDYIVRYKMSSNPGRIIVWGKLGIPVVSDMFPSAMECIEHGRSGFLSISRAGWFHSLEALINDEKLRQTFSLEIKKRINKFDYYNQNTEFIEKLETLIRGK